MTTLLNKESSVKTIDRVAVELGEDVDWLFEIAIETEPEDGVIWVFSLDDKEGSWPLHPTASSACDTSSVSTGGHDFCGHRRMLTAFITADHENRVFTRGFSPSSGRSMVHWAPVSPFNDITKSLSDIITVEAGTFDPASTLTPEKSLCRSEGWAEHDA